jgi:hypothetical protein
VGAFFSGLTFSVLCVIFLKTWLPWGWVNEHTRGFLIKTMALAVALHLSWLQVPNRNGVMIGLLAGSLAPYLAEGIMALFEFIRQAWTKNAKDETP